MSRTFRRNKKGLVNRRIGTREEFHREYSYWMWRYPCLNINQIYDRVVARFHRDEKSGLYSAPRHFRHVYYNGPIRRAEKREIQRCLSADTWDDHLSGGHHTGAKAQWGWIMT